MTTLYSYKLRFCFNSNLFLTLKNKVVCRLFVDVVLELHTMDVGLCVNNCGQSNDCNDSSESGSADNSGDFSVSFSPGKLDSSTGDTYSVTSGANPLILVLRRCGSGRFITEKQNTVDVEDIAVPVRAFGDAVKLNLDLSPTEMAPMCPVGYDTRGMETQHKNHVPKSSCSDVSSKLTVTKSMPTSACESSSVVEQVVTVDENLDLCLVCTENSNSQSKPSPLTSVSRSAVVTCAKYASGFDVERCSIFSDSDYSTVGQNGALHCFKTTCNGKKEEPSSEGTINIDHKSPNNRAASGHNSSAIHQMQAVSQSSKVNFVGDVQVDGTLFSSDVSAGAEEQHKMYTTNSDVLSQIENLFGKKSPCTRNDFAETACPSNHLSQSKQIHSLSVSRDSLREMSTDCDAHVIVTDTLKSRTMSHELERECTQSITSVKRTSCCDRCVNSLSFKKRPNDFISPQSSDPSSVDEAVWILAQRDHVHVKPADTSVQNKCFVPTDNINLSGTALKQQAHASSKGVATKALEGAVDRGSADTTHTHHSLISVTSSEEQYSYCSGCKVDDEPAPSLHLRLARLQNLLSGVPPPPSVTIPQFDITEMLSKLQDNRMLLCSNSASPNNRAEFKTSCGAESSSSWLPPLNACCYDVHYNDGYVSEEYELLSQKFAERYVGGETASSFTDGVAHSLGNHTKRKAMGYSPGRRLSHLARRRQVFAPHQRERSLLTGARQIMVEARKTSKAQKTENGYKDLMNTQAEYLTSVKNYRRTLFMSPGQKQKYRSSPAKTRSGNKTKNSPFRKSQSQSKHALVSNPADGCKLSPSKKSRPGSKGRKLNFEAESKELCPATSSSVAVQFVESTCSKSPCHSGQPKQALSVSHKKKLLWAVAEALREKGIGISDAVFRQCAAGLARQCCNVLIEQCLTGSTSERMLQLARKYATAVVTRVQAVQNQS